jgi:PknH-like protein
MGLSRINCTHVQAAAETPADLASLGGPRRSLKGRIVIRGPAATLAAIEVVVALAACSGHGAPTTTTTPTPTVARERLDSSLLTESEAGTILGASDLKASEISHQTDTTARTLSIPDCLGAYVSATDTVYKDSGYTAISAVYLNGPENYVVQAAVSFPSADQALAFVKSSAPKWRACAGQNLTSEKGDQYFRYTFGPLVGDAPKIAQLQTKEAGNGYACQHVLSAVSNLVIDVDACGYHISDQGSQMADKIAAKATH